MEAEFQKFKASMPLYTREQLVELCLQLWQENRACTIALTEYRASDTRMARDYQDALQKIKELEAQTKDQQKTIDRVCAQNAVLTRQRFGSHNEKLDALHAPFGEEIQDPLSEEADPDQPPTDAEKVPPSPRKSERKKSEAQAADSDGKARTDARKLIADTLGKGRMKKQPTKMDYSSLPHCNTYTLDVEKQDKIYGKDNWVIVNWHKKTLLHRPLTSYYVEEVYTPVIKSLETGELEADPMPPVLLKGSPVSEDLLAFIIYEKYFKSVPLYRLSADMANQGLILPRQDMANWIIRFTEGNLLTPYYYMQKLQCARSYGQSDETPLQVLHEAGRDARTKSYMWIHITGELDEGPFIVVFVYNTKSKIFIN